MVHNSQERRSHAFSGRDKPLKVSSPSLMGKLVRLKLPSIKQVAARFAAMALILFTLAKASGSSMNLLQYQPGNEVHHETKTLQDYLLRRDELGALKDHVFNGSNINFHEMPFLDATDEEKELLHDAVRGKFYSDKKSGTAYFSPDSDHVNYGVGKVVDKSVDVVDIKLPKTHFLCKAFMVGGKRRLVMITDNLDDPQSLNQQWIIALQARERLGQDPVSKKCTSIICEESHKLAWINLTSGDVFQDYTSEGITPSSILEEDMFSGSDNGAETNTSASENAMSRSPSPSNASSGKSRFPRPASQSQRRQFKEKNKGGAEKYAGKDWFCVSKQCRKNGNFRIDSTKFRARRIKSNDELYECKQSNNEWTANTKTVSATKNWCTNEKCRRCPATKKDRILHGYYTMDGDIVLSENGKRVVSCGIRYILPTSKRSPLHQRSRQKNIFKPIEETVDDATSLRKKRKCPPGLGSNSVQHKTQSGERGVDPIKTLHWLCSCKAPGPPGWKETNILERTTCKRCGASKPLDCLTVLI